MQLQPVILSGGSGTRLWPLSRELYPKQFLPLTGEKSMLQETVRRLDGLFGSDAPGELLAPIIVCNEEHRFLVAEQLRQLERQAQAIVLEPLGRNTAPALTATALFLLDAGQDPVMLVMPADHVIAESAAFHRAVLAGARLAEDGYLVTFGIVPSAAETGYGYIEQGDAIVTGAEAAVPSAHRIAAFVEKPNLATAQSYLSAGGYLWNSGMFMMKPSVWTAAMERFRPDILQACRASIEAGQRDQDFFRLGKDAFKTCPSDSIDYAVMEKVVQPGSGTPDKAAVLPLDAGWSDIGAWSALWEVQGKDSDGNAVSGDVLLQSTRNTLAMAQSRLVTTVGVEDLIIVETADAVLVAQRDSVQGVKEVVAELKARGRSEHVNHRRVHRPWGTYETIDIGERYQVKRITVNPGSALSLQMHHHRAEHWVVVTGTARVTRGEETFLVTENQSTYIPLGVKHRLDNPGKFPLEMIEVQSGGYLGEDDIVRFEDNYGR